jgi:signal transduction histidine kinase/HAMP domain-containing protein
MSIRLKLTTLFLAIALVPLLLIAVLTFENYKKSLESACIADLQDIAAFQAEKIELYLHDSKGNTVDMASIFNLMQGAVGLGNTGEVVLAKKEGDQLVYLNPLKHDPHPGFQYKAKIGSKFAIPMQNALQGKAGAGIAIDYRGHEVIAAWRYIPSLGWGMVAKIDTSEAFTDVEKLKRITAMILIIISVIVGIMASLIARSVAGKINKLSEDVAAIGQGDLDHRVVIGARDEIGRLSQALSKMTQDLRKVTASRDELNREVTMRKGIEEELFKVNRILRALSNSNQAMMRAQDETDCLNQVCRIIIKDCGYAMVWVGFAVQDEAKSVRPVAQAGFEEGYLKALDVTWADNERGRGPTGTAIRTGQVTVCRDILNDPNFKPWRDEAIKRGYASSLVVPFSNVADVFGAISIYSRSPDPFSPQEIALLSELADDLAFGIMFNRLRAALKDNEQALQRSHDELEGRVNQRTAQLVEAQKEVDRSKRLSDIGTLAATVAHELRNPLAAVKMAVYNIKRKAKNPILEKHLNNIDLKVQESEQIINNLLFYARLKMPHYGKINIYNILNSCLNEAAARFSRPGVYVERRIEALKDLLVEADPLQIKEVFSNIVNNAYDALLEHEGKITVSAQVDDMSATIVVKDGGAGIHPDNLARLFEPFFTTKSKGIGLGLAVSRQIVNLHGGSINIESTKGQGATVTVCLPIARKKND